MFRMKTLVLFPVVALAFAGCGGPNLPSSAANSAPPPDTTPPTAPTGLTATATSSAQTGLAWAAATDNVAVTGYRVERCAGASCTNFAQIAAPVSTTLSDTGLAASTSYSYRVRAADAAGNMGAYSNIASATTMPPAPGAQDFPTRCNATGVLRCVGFDAASDISGAYGSNSGIIPGNSTNPIIDTTVKASGAGSLKFIIPTLSGENSSGAYFTNFSNDLSVQFGENQEFYVQWRQRFSPEFVNTFYTNSTGGGANGWKQIIIGSGDQVGCSSGNAVSPPCYASCTDLETVVQNTGQRKFPQMYNSCTGSTSHSAFDNLYVFLPATNDFKLQNARPSPFCLYSQGSTVPPTYFPPNGNCVGYVPNTWMTFQIKIKTGPRLTTGLMDEWTNSSITLWVAQEGQASQLVIDFPGYNLTAGAPALNQKFGKVWLLPFHTNKSNTQNTPEAYTWYDELIVSTTQIADPL